MRERWAVGCCYKQNGPPHISCYLELNSASGPGGGEGSGIDTGRIFEP